MGYLELQADPFNSAYQSTFLALFGTDYHKIQLFMNQAEMQGSTIENADMDIFYWHPISQFWAIKGGANYVYRPAENNHTYFQPGVGIEGLMPFFIQTNLRMYYHNGSAKFDLELSRAIQIAYNISLQVGLRGIAATKTFAGDKIGSGFNVLQFTVRPFYQISPNFTVYFEYEHDRFYAPLKRILIADGDGFHSDTYSFGIATLF